QITQELEKLTLSLSRVFERMRDELQ
ncbi:DUF3907 domain-containing protein, partial [Mesorhizobium sp. M00.F.Ca.ET.186.01.1.1]